MRYHLLIALAVVYLTRTTVSVHGWEGSEGSYLLATLSPDKNVNIGQSYKTLDYVQWQSWLVFVVFFTSNANVWHGNMATTVRLGKDHGYDKSTIMVCVKVVTQKISVCFVLHTIQHTTATTPLLFQECNRRATGASVYSTPKQSHAVLIKKSVSKNGNWDLISCCTWCE